MDEQQPSRTTERWVGHTVSEAEAGRMVRDVLLRTLRLSKQMVKRLAQSDGIRLNGTRPYLSNRVAAGDQLAVRVTSADEAVLRPVPMELDVAYEDEDVLVVDKPAGLLVHPSRRSHVHTLAHGVTYHLRQRGGSGRTHPVHRLDRGTSGLVLFAKHALAHQRLDRQLRAREMRREYLALVHGAPEEAAGEIDAPIGVHPEDAHLRTATGTDGADARTRYRVVERFATAALIKVELETGRTHQIRVHLAHIGHPLLGDASYGGEPHPLLLRQALHAHRLTFLHPLGGQPITCEAALPGDMEALVRSLRAGVDR